MGIYSSRSELYSCQPDQRQERTAQASRPCGISNSVTATTGPSLNHSDREFRDKHPSPITKIVPMQPISDPDHW
jgi:hypothetical protein